MRFYFDIAYDKPNGRYVGVAHHEEERDFPSDGAAHTYFLSLLDKFSVRETYYLCRWGPIDESDEIENEWDDA